MKRSGSVEEDGGERPATVPPLLDHGLLRTVGNAAPSYLGTTRNINVIGVNSRKPIEGNKAIHVSVPGPTSPSKRSSACSGCASYQKATPSGGSVLDARGERNIFSCSDDSDSCNPFATPRNEIEKSEGEALVVKELNQMSINERERLYEDIHGVAEPIQETEEFLAEKLADMQTAIEWIKTKPAYERARFMLPSSVEDRCLRLAMLRSSDYDGIKAARKMCAHFQFKLELFGIDKLVYPITQDDLTEGMKAALMTGYHQILPFPDRSGRNVAFVASNNIPNTDNWRDIFGVSWYIYMKVMKDIETQIKGSVTVLYSIGVRKSTPTLSGMLGKTSDFENAMPTKSSCAHFVYDDARYRPILSLLQLVLAKNHRLRLRSHFGSHTEARYNLMGYGLRPDFFPVDQIGNIDVNAWHLHLNEMNLKEREKAMSSRSIITPKRYDVLLGRGYPFQSFAGNVFLADIVQRNRALYSTLKRTPKTNMTVGVVKYIQEVKGGRFLKRIVEPDVSGLLSNEIWATASESEARLKVSRCFRGPVREEVLFSGDSAVYTIDNGESIAIPRECTKNTITS